MANREKVKPHLPPSTGGASPQTNGKKLIICSPQEVVPAKKQVKSLLNLCVATLGRHLHEVIDDIHLIAAFLPPQVKIKLVAIARRRGLLCDKLLVALADEGWDVLDLSGSDVTDDGVHQVAKVCHMLKAIDVSCCSRLTAQSIREFFHHCPLLETLRCGGTRMSNTAARLSLPCILPGLNVDKDAEDSWEELETQNVGTGAQALQWIVWPSIDAESRDMVGTQCPKVAINPKVKRFAFLQHEIVPREAVAETVLDEVHVEDMDPRTWDVRSSHAVAAAGGSDGSGVSMAERFRLAFVARDERLAPKRAKNLRQNQRRDEKQWLSSNIEARAHHLAATALNLL